MYNSFIINYCNPIAFYVLVLVLVKIYAYILPKERFFPVAGGPYSNITLHGFRFPKQANKLLFFPKQQYNIHISGHHKSSHSY